MNTFISGILIIFFILMPARADNSFNLKINEETTLQPIFDALTTAGALNYGYYGEGQDWAMNINEIDINLVTGETYNFEIDITASFYFDLDILNGLFNNTFENQIINLSANLFSEYDDVTGEFLLKIELVDVNINDFPDTIEDIGFMYLRFENLTILNLIDFYPELDPYYFQTDFPSLTVIGDNIILSVNLNDEIEVSNKSNSNTNGFLDGELSVINLDTPPLSKTGLGSPSIIFARVNDQYTSHTHQFFIGDKIHLGWLNNSDLKTNTNPFILGQQYFDNGLTALYKDQFNVSIQSNIENVDISFRDPWYIPNPEEDHFNWSQPNEFRSLSELDDGNGNIQVFLNQNLNFEPEIPIYRIKAVKVFASQDGIYQFSGWTGTDVYFGSYGNTSINNNITDVVFLSEEASAVASYTLVNNQPGTLVVSYDETLIIPAGANIACKSSTDINNQFKIMVEGNLLIKGTKENIAVLQSDSPSEEWGGITLVGDSEISGDFGLIKGANKAIACPDMFYTYYHGINYTSVSIDLKNMVFDKNTWVFYFDPRGCPSDGVPDIFSTGGVIEARIYNCTINSSDGNVIEMVSINRAEELINPLHCPGQMEDNFENLILQWIFINNIFNNTNFQIEEGYSTNIHWYSNLFYNSLVYTPYHSNGWNPGENGITECFSGNGNITGVPLFVDEVNGDYHLTEFSPAIDAGMCDLDGDGSTYIYDIDDQDSDGTRMDMGAFYYVIGYSDFVLSISGEIGDHPTISWNTVFFGENNQDPAVNYEIYSFNEFDQTPIFFTETTGITIDDERFIIAYIEEDETGRNVGLKKLDKEPEQTSRIKRFWDIKAIDIHGHKTDHSPSVYAWVEIDGAAEKLATPIIPKDYELNAAFPNPFNPVVTVPFGLPVESDVTISIYNLMGQRLRTFESNNTKAGYHQVQWNSLTNTGRKVPSGLYIVRLNATSTYGEKSFTKLQKIVLLK